MAGIMAMPIINTYNTYRIGSNVELGAIQMEQLVDLFQRPRRIRSEKLDGRTPILKASIDRIGPVAVKSYTRGGLVNYISKYHYLRSGKPRCRKEYEMLATVQQLGASVPEPIAFAYRGLVTYCGWLVTREVNAPISLAKLCQVDESRCRMALERLTEQISILVDNGVLHVDLHPGNVLIDDCNRVYIVDFDRAGIKNWSKKKLHAHYLARWIQAVDKHNLPALLREGFPVNSIKVS